MTESTDRRAGQRPLRILHLATRASGGGSERHLRHAIAVEEGFGDIVEVAVGRDSQFNDDSHLTVHRLPHLRRDPSPWQDALAYLEIRQLLKNGKYDLLFTHEAKAGILGRLATAGRVERTVHTLHGASLGPAYGRFTSSVYRLAERACSARTDYLVAVGHELLDLYVSMGVAPAERCVVLRSPVRLEDFLRVRGLTPTYRERLRASYGTNGKRALLAAGRLERDKRFDLLISELAPAIAGGKYVLTIAGDGPERDRLCRLSQRRGVAESVRLLGHVADLASVMAAHDAFVSTSRNEGLPQVAVQAVAAGLPVVATDVPGLREIPGDAITVASRSGKGLERAVAIALEEAREVDPSALAEWADSSVSAARAAFHHSVRMSFAPYPVIDAAKATV